MGLFTAAGFWTWNRVDQNRRALLAEKAKEQEATRIEGLVGRLVSAEPNQIPDIVKQLDANPQVASTFLSPLVLQTATTQDEKRNQLHARLAMVSAIHRSSYRWPRNCSVARSPTSRRFARNCAQRHPN